MLVILMHYYLLRHGNRKEKAADKCGEKAKEYGIEWCKILLGVYVFTGSMLSKVKVRSKLYRS